MTGDEGYINKFPDDAAEMAVLIQQADLPTAVSLLQVWGSKQRDIGAISALKSIEARLAPAEMTADLAEDLTRRAT